MMMCQDKYPFNRLRPVLIINLKIRILAIYTKRKYKSYYYYNHQKRKVPPTLNLEFVSAPRKLRTRFFI